VMPVREICRAARVKGVITVVDGAHMHGQIPFRIDELECDFLAGSPHKWLFAPPGCGLLYIRDEMLDRLWPLVTTEAWTNLGLKAARFMQVGTNSRAVLEGMGAGIRFAQAIGAGRVYGRIHELARRARGLAAGISELELLTPDDDRLYGGLVAFRMPKALFEAFAKKAAAEKMWVYGSPLMRIATHVHTRPQDVDRFFELIRGSRGA
jgi:isopenicillin-N epimerase